MIASLARPPIARALRSPRLLAALGGWCGLAIVSAAVTRSALASHGADRALIGIFGSLSLPLIAYALVGTVVGPRSVAGAAAPLVLFGSTPARAGGVAVVVAMGGAALVGSALAASVSLIAHGDADPPRLHDALVSAYVGAFGGGAYAAWFALGAGLGRRGGGRTALLAVDWVLGEASGLGALLTPRGHIRNLLGGHAPMDLTERESAAVLAVLAVVCAIVAARRARARVSASRREG